MKDKKQKYIVVGTVSCCNFPRHACIQSYKILSTSMLESINFTSHFIYISIFIKIMICLHRIFDYFYIIWMSGYEVVALHTKISKHDWQAGNTSLDIFFLCQQLLIKRDYYLQRFIQYFWTISSDHVKNIFYRRQ